MSMILVSIFDSKTRTWSEPVSVPNVPTACRMADQMVRNSKSIHSQYPEDFSLWNIGDFDQDDGDFELRPVTPVKLCEFADFVHPEAT